MKRRDVFKLLAVAPLVPLAAAAVEPIVFASSPVAEIGTWVSAIDVDKASMDLKRVMLSLRGDGKNFIR